MKKRLIYEAPMGELILVRFEENILTSGNNTTSSTLFDRYSGQAGSAGANPNDPNSFSGGSIDL